MGSPLSIFCQGRASATATTLAVRIPRPHPLVCVFVRNEERVSKNNHREEKTLLIPVTVTVTDESSEGRWLSERTEAAGYVVIFVSAFLTVGG